MARTLVTLLLLVALATGAPVPAQQRILPLGDSITESYAGYAGYRWFLWKYFDQAKACVDFVGCRHGVAGGAPLFDDFDQDHSGFSGHSAVGIAYQMRSNPACVPAADIALVHLGTNDIILPLLLGCPPDLLRALGAMERIVESLRVANPEVKIAIASILPIMPESTILPTAHEYVPIWNQVFLPRLLELSTPTSPIVLVDINTGVIPRRDLRDDVHPTDVGAVLIAERWFTALATRGWILEGRRCVASLSPGCAVGPRASVPRLSITTPAIGGTVTALVRDLPDECAGVALVIGSSEAGPPINWYGCPLHPSLDAVVFSPLFVRHAPQNLAFPLSVPPSIPQGFEIYVQAVATAQTGANATSNALQVLLY